MDRDTFKKKAKVIDMMLTMHSILAARYQRKATGLEIALLAVSIILAALTFADPKVLAHFDINFEATRVIIGVFSILVFFLSIVSLLVDWKGKASQHRKAFDTLIPLKSEWGHMVATFDEHSDEELASFAQQSSLKVGSLIPIPDSKFNQLKARHYRKVFLSRLISANPGSSPLILRLCLWWRATCKAVKSDDIKGRK